MTSLKDKIRSWWPLSAIVLVSLIIRLIDLSRLAFGFQHDELFAGYVGRYIIIHKGVDIAGRFLPWYFNTFGDFRPIGVFCFQDYQHLYSELTS